ncbi:pH-response regulator protein palH/rim21 [Didymosphaeria variabile]|uniref:PH-response regulator protein palH/rim21 n=1 Tax=Didymosphaeria variabile TaxID=1932322 RepID=A0A9W8XR77_9PLEO|nr:pH-response regulator protein palH/rim21 [Didymosphaeria variabile]KAJ4356827.1 pH-response regulator protein palH/rim21 [Didymosphaeria variabile]
MTPHCAPFKLPSLGTIQISPDHTITLEADAVFTPQCPPTEQSQVNEGSGTGNDSDVMSVTDLRDPFHASITPQAYATGAATVLAWMLVIMLIITPRTFFVGGASGRSGLMGRRGMISGAGGGGSVIGVGTRPWLQKVAALTVAVSLTLATADTFEIAERQYNEGFMDAMKLRNEVVAGTEIKVSRIISDIFLWLAQVQTLIRLFPRHKEKVMIKWIGFALILLDIVFNSINSFGPYNKGHSPRHFETAIPALSYLFQLSLSMLYAAWVIYYAITKRRYAFYHPMMWNMSLVALLSIVAILTPVVFFITDISNYTIAGWGDYFRWVGAAAASVIVWEWVERIEALEREERKDGILGREIYDGDEMLNTTPSHEMNWHGSKRQSSASDDSKKSGDGGNGAAFTSGHRDRLTNLAHRLNRVRKPSPKPEHNKKRTIHIPAPPPAARRSGGGQRSKRNTYVPLQSPTAPPPNIASPVSRTDTASADSTVYTVRYHPISDTPPAPRLETAIEEGGTAGAAQTAPQHSSQTSVEDLEKGVLTEDAGDARGRSQWNWQTIASMNPFRRRGRSPPPEIQRGRVIEPLVVEDVPLNIPQRNYTGLALKDRLGTFAAQQGERFRSRKGSAPQDNASLPVTIIPAQPRGRTWSPEILLQQLQASEGSGVQNSTEASHTTPSATHITSTPSPLPTGTDGPGSPGRASTIRFTPETFLPFTARPQAQRERTQSSSPSVALGTEVSENSGETTLSQEQEQRSQSNHTPTPSQPTNHDR